MAFSLLLNASHSSPELTLKSFHTVRGFVFGFSIKQRSWASSVKRKNHTNSKLIYCVANVQKWRVCQRRWSTDHWKFGMHNCSFLLFFYRKTEINAVSSLPWEYYAYRWLAWELCDPHNISFWKIHKYYEQFLWAFFLFHCCCCSNFYKSFTFHNDSFNGNNIIVLWYQWATTERKYAIHFDFLFSYVNWLNGVKIENFVNVLCFLLHLFWMRKSAIKNSGKT